MSFAAPLVLLALLAIPFLIWWYRGQQRRRDSGSRGIRHAGADGVGGAAPAAVAPSRCRCSRSLLALAVLIVAAARPQRSVAVPVDQRRDHARQRRQQLDERHRCRALAPGSRRSVPPNFLGDRPGSVQVGVLEFAKTPIVLQSPTTDHALTRTALGQLHTSGGTAIGDAILTSLRQIRNVPRDRRQASARRDRAALRRRLERRRRSARGGARGGIAAHPGLHGRARHIPRHDPHHEARHQTVDVPCRRARGARADRKRLRRAGVHRRRHGRPARGLRAPRAPSSVTRRSSNEITASFAGGGLALLLRRQRPVAPLVRPPDLDREQSRRTDERDRPDQTTSARRRATPSRRRSTRSSA